MPERSPHPTTPPELVYGRHPVLEALRARAPLDKVLIQQGTHGPFEVELRNLCRDANVPMQPVPPERLNFLCRGNHQGVVAVVASVAYRLLEEVLPAIFQRGETPLVVLLDGVTDVRNVGAIARTAEGFGAHALVVPHRGAATLGPDAMKASAGALNWLPVCRATSMHVAVETLQTNGISVFASEMGNGKPLYETDFSGPTGLLFGAEGEGIQRNLLRLADGRFFVPMLGKIESFNVSVAAGMALYEAIRQRRPS
jgi:23S rRNA (guanosine2251-2'-O)-methyltransferase